jgi:phospholipid transport system substrate-binding protein
LAAPAAAQQQTSGSADGAARFVERLGQEAVDELARADLPVEKRQQFFLELLQRGFAMDAISRFVLGRYWRAASEQERAEFQDVFQRVLAQRFLPLFEGYEDDDFQVRGAGPDPSQPELFAVRSLVTQPGQPQSDQMVRVIWRVRHQDGSYEIVDVKAEGVSMAITLRSEYNSAIKRAGGSVARLISMLEDNLAKGAYAPKEGENAFN